MADYLNDLSTYPIFKFEPDWEAAIPSEFTLNQKVQNYAGTVDQLITFSDERPFLCELPFKIDNKEDEYNFISFFVNQVARWKKFWLPAPYSFFQVDEAITITDEILIVEDQKFRDAFRGFERIFLLLESGDYLTFKINSVEVGPLGAQETLHLSAGFDRSIALEEIVTCSFIHLVRFDYDQLKLDYITDYVLTTKLRFKELIKEYELL